MYRRWEDHLLELEHWLFYNPLLMSNPVVVSLAAQIEYLQNRRYLKESGFDDCLLVYK